MQLPPAASEFDFWLGEWDARWEEGCGTNVVTAELDGRVIFERFDGRPGMPLRGMSVSVYDAARGRWKQTWVDSDGNYLVFVGGFEGGEMDLRMERDVEGRPVTHRMLWHAIALDSFQWEWERRGADGRWETLWHIDYTRRNAAARST